MMIGFLTYVSRSGSTILGRLLNEYSDICVTTEASFPPEMMGVKGYSPIKFSNKVDINSYLSYIRRHTKFDTWNISDIDIIKRHMSCPITDSVQLFRLLLEIYAERVKPNARLILYKGSPAMPVQIQHIKRVFPQAIYMYIYRDPRAIYFSQKRSINPYRNREFSQSPIETSMMWKKSYKACMEKQGRAIIRIKYEDLMRQTEQVINKSILTPLKLSTELYSGIGLSERLPEKERDIHRLVNDRPDIKRINAWQDNLNNREIRLIESLTYPEIIDGGYNIMPVSVWARIKGELLLKWFSFCKFSKRFQNTARRIIDNPRYYLKRI